MMMMGYSAVMAVPNGEFGQRASIQRLDRRKEEKQIPSPVFDGQWGALIVVADKDCVLLVNGRRNYFLSFRVSGVSLKAKC